MDSTNLVFSPSPNRKSNQRAIVCQQFPFAEGLVSHRIKRSKIQASSLESTDSKSFELQKSIFIPLENTTYGKHPGFEYVTKQEHEKLAQGLVQHQLIDPFWGDPEMVFYAIQSFTSLDFQERDKIIVNMLKNKYDSISFPDSCLKLQVYYRMFPLVADQLATVAIQLVEAKSQDRKKDILQLEEKKSVLYQVLQFTGGEEYFCNLDQEKKVRLWKNVTQDLEKSSVLTMQVAIHMWSEKEITSHARNYIIQNAPYRVLQDYLLNETLPVLDPTRRMKDLVFGCFTKKEEKTFASEINQEKCCAELDELLSSLPCLDYLRMEDEKFQSQLKMRWERLDSEIPQEEVDVIIERFVEYLVAKSYAPSLPREKLDGDEENHSSNGGAFFRALEDKARASGKWKSLEMRF